MVAQDAETDKEVAQRDLVRVADLRRIVRFLQQGELRAGTNRQPKILTISERTTAAVGSIQFGASWQPHRVLSPSRMFSLALRDRICRCDITALSSMVIARRGGAVAILPSGNECADHTLHEAQFCNDMLAFEDTKGRYLYELHEIVEAKLKGEGITSRQPNEPERDLSSTGGGKGKPRPSCIVSCHKEPKASAASQMAGVSRNPD
jgi:hypothetical protein